MHDAGMMTLAEAMKAKGMKDTSLAADAGCDRSMITRIRLGKVTPSLPLAVTLGKLTGASIETMVRQEQQA